MSEHQNIVSGTVVQDEDGQKFIDVPRRSACQSCGKSSGCGMSVLGGLGGHKPIRFRFNGDARVGQSIELGCSQDGLLKAAFWAYAPAAICMVGAPVLAALNGSGEGVQMLSALGGLFIGLMLTRKMTRGDRVPALHVVKE